MTTPEAPARQFGTFGGVFTPCAVTIVGVMLFLRFGQVVGQAGLQHAILIVLCAKFITTVTAASLSAIATNTRVRGGGVYFLISRSLGMSAGGAIGLLFYLAQTVAVAMYVIGFTEAFRSLFPSLPIGFTATATLVNALVLVSVYIGAGWTIRLQYGILTSLVLAILSYTVGCLRTFSWETFATNWTPAYAPDSGFLVMFALFFPAVTGIAAGSNMSGDLRDPGRSIPRGTLWAVGVTGLIYLGTILLLGGAAPRDVLVHDNLVLEHIAVLPALVMAGVFAATLSSALGSMMGAPRILQAIARDRIFPQLRAFAHTSGKNREPRRAILLSAVIAQIAILAGDLNAIAPIITMFFLITYGMVNLACFAELASRNPSFRPTFRLRHSGIPFVGGLGCLVAMVLISPWWAVLSTAVMALTYRYLKRSELEVRWGDVNSGMAYERGKRNLLLLEDERYHPKNWRPSVLALVGAPEKRFFLAQVGSWLTDRGFLSLAHVTYDRSEQGPELAAKREQVLRELIRSSQIAAFPVAIAAPTFLDGARALIQCHGLGRMRPNTVLLGWSESPAKMEDFGSVLRLTRSLQRSIILVRNNRTMGPSDPPPEGSIDVWWRGRQHGPLMLLLAHLLRQNPAWKSRPIRLLRAIPSDTSETSQELSHLERLVRESRIPAQPLLVPTDDITTAIRLHSANASVAFLGFVPPEKGGERAFVERTRALIDSLPTAVLVCSAGDMHLEA